MAIKFGAAGNDPDLFMGALTTLAGDETRAKQALALAEQLTPELKEFDPYIAAMKYFTGMTAAASQPGATVFGSAAQAFASPVAYLEEVNEFNDKIKASTPKTAVTLAQALKPPAGKVTYRPASAKELKDYGATAGQMSSDGKFYDLSKTSSTSITKPFDVKITNPAAFNTEFGNVTLPEDGIIPLTSAQLAQLPMGSYEFPEPPDSNATKPFSIEILNDDAFKEKFPNTTIPDDKIISIDAEDANLLPIGSYKLSTPKKEGVEKYLQLGRVLYMTEPDAIEKLKLLKVTPESPEYEDLLALITTDDEELIGRPVIQADSYISFYTPRAGEDSEFNVITRTPGGSPVPAEVLLRNQELTKLVPIALKQRQVMNDLLPTLDSAMTVLLQNPDTTGAFQEFTLPIRNFLSSAFGFSDAELSDQLLLNAISNKLAPQMRPVGSGSTSDMEFRAYKSAILTMGNTGKANYLTLYSLDKTTRNAAEELQLRKTLLSQNKSEKYISEKILELDKGIYAKFDGMDDKDSDGNFIYNNAEEYRAARDAWKNSLTGGTVILNKDASGKKIFPNAGTFIIKGWRGQE